VDLKVSLGDPVRQSHQKRGLSQFNLAQRMGSSHSRVAKLETGDPSELPDLIVQAFFASGGYSSGTAEGGRGINIRNAHNLLFERVSSWN
jgi:transcriptional regulator with XRE-family HTH domain